jgi:hypothetical protein
MWKINYPGEHCNGQRPGLIAHVVIDIITVVGIYLWPLPVLLRATILPWKQRVLAVGLIAIGALRLCTRQHVLVHSEFVLMDIVVYVYPAYCGYPLLYGQLALVAQISKT